VAEQPPPKPRALSHREALREALLQGGPRTARELSVELSMQEREVVEHLAHLERSLAHSAQRLEVTPARCLACGYEFRDRQRLSKPGRCPSCKATRISLPRFHISYD
jgi:predicted Zn-ribbon and HTH transcriptional regulator